jgi:hypothetical protein
MMRTSNMPMRLDYRLVAAFFLAAALAVAGCANLPTPATFNQRVAYADATAAAVGRTCVDLSKRDRIPVDTLVRCRAVVTEAGSVIDTARALGAGPGDDRLAAAQQLLLKLESELRAREAR